MTTGESARTRAAFTALVLAVAFLYLYAHVLARLLHDWASDDNYSHGFLIIPLALYFVWERREPLARLPRRPAFAGLLVVVLALAMFAAGVLGVEFFLTRVSMIALLAGTVVFVLGWPHLRVLAFPLAFLLLMIPIPAIVFNQIAFPLQLLASRFGQLALTVAGIPVLREGNVITLANTTLEVAEACSGIRSLVSLITLALVYGYFLDRRTWLRVVLVLAAVPIAIAANGVRIAGTGLAASLIGPSAAEGFFHTFSGWLVFVLAVVLLVLVHVVAAWAARRARRVPPPTEATVS